MSAPFPFDPFNAEQFDALMRAPGPDVVDCTGVQTGNTDIEASESGRYPIPTAPAPPAGAIQQ